MEKLKDQKEKRILSYISFLYDRQEQCRQTIRDARANNSQNLKIIEQKKLQEIAWMDSWILKQLTFLIKERKSIWQK